MVGTVSVEAREGVGVVEEVTDCVRRKVWVEVGMEAVFDVVVVAEAMADEVGVGGILDVFEMAEVSVAETVAV